MNIICFFRTLWRTAMYMLRTGDATLVCGHSWKEKEIDYNKTVSICKCKICGKYILVGTRR